MRRFAALALALLLFLTAGCAALFDTEVYLEEPYEAPSDAGEAGEDESADTISNYAALRRAIVRLVSERAESAVLQFQNYEGTVSRDISTACWEVKSSTALGAFAVDYISFDLSRIVSYTQAEINITYKRSEYQMSCLEQLPNLAALRTRLADALRAGDTYLVLELTTASLSADTVRQAVEKAYYEDPMTCPVLPAAEATLYPDSGVNRIVEATLDYGLDSGSLARRREELTSALETLLAAAVPEEGPAEEDAESSGEPEESGPAELVRGLCAAVADGCLWDEAAGTTAWDALTAGSAASEGMAMALEAACQAVGVDCRIVLGRLDGESHVWNIVTLGDDSYHVDVSRWDAGEEQVFLVGDEALWGAYWWDTSEYPACPATFGASEEPSAELATAEPEETGDGEESIES